MNIFNISCMFSFDDYILENLTNRKDIVAYGGVNCLWHGGRFIENIYTLEDIESIINKYNSNNIPCRFVFSNHKLTKEDLNDELCNKILDILSKNEMNGVIISSDILYDYIKSKYPNMKIVASMIKTCIETDNWKYETYDFYNSLCEKYDIVVLNPGRNIDLNFLSKLKYKDKIEILINSHCTRFCKTAKLHYDIIADKIRGKQSEVNDINKIKCVAGKSILDNNICYLSIEQFETLKKLGFSNFKIEGRGQSIEYFIHDINYFLLS